MGLNQFYQWQQEKEGRSVTIKIGECLEPNKLKVWVYDYKLGAGQHVTSLDEIDLEAAKEKRERAELERLRSKYETS